MLTSENTSFIVFLKVSSLPSFLRKANGSLLVAARQLPGSSPAGAGSLPAAAGNLQLCELAATHGYQFTAAEAVTAWGAEHGAELPHWGSGEDWLSWAVWFLVTTRVEFTTESPTDN